jgi:hypothetical protein
MRLLASTGILATGCGNHAAGIETDSTTRTQSGRDSSINQVSGLNSTGTLGIVLAFSLAAIVVATLIFKAYEFTLRSLGNLRQCLVQLVATLRHPIRNGGRHHA